MEQLPLWITFELTDDPQNKTPPSCFQALIRGKNNPESIAQLLPDTRTGQLREFVNKSNQAPLTSGGKAALVSCPAWLFQQLGIIYPELPDLPEEVT